MADESTTEPPPDLPPPLPGDSTSPPPPPTGGPVERPPLRRSRSDRVIAGVAGGVGHHFDVDPVLVRIGFVVLALFGGSGIALYVIAWLVIAEEGNEDSAAIRALRGREQRSGRGIVAILLLIAGLLLVGGPFVWATGVVFGEGLVLPLLLMAAGVALLVWPEDHERSDRHGNGATRHAAGAQMKADIAAARDDITSSFAAVRDEVREEWSTAFDDIEKPTGGAAPSGFTPPPPTPSHAPPPEPPAPRPKPFIGPLTLAALLLFTGAAVAVDRADLIDVDPAIGLAIALTIVGIALTVTAFVGRARGLIAVGVLLLPLVWWFHAIDLTWWDGIGDETFVVDDLDELQDDYRYGIGQLTIDLTGLDLDGETRELAVGLTIGEVIVLVPDNFEIDLDADGRIGEVRIEGPQIAEIIDDGFDPALDETFGDAEGGRLELDLDVGLGSARVEVR